MNPLEQLAALGQSVWIDYLSRDYIESGKLKEAIARDGLKGMTSNPSIFEKAIVHGNEYDADIKRFAEKGESAGAIYRHLSVRDIQEAADALRPVHDATGGADGFVSIEVSPYLALDTEASIAEARSLWAEIGRPNLMVKIPGTEQGIPAIRTLIGEGINVNITLLFSRQRYADVVEAYLSGLETRKGNGGLDGISSVASFFVSRIDTMADAAIEEKMKLASGDARSDLESLRGKVAIANAKLAYDYYKRVFSSERWKTLAAKGARRQRLLWASTSTKNKAYPDVLYVDSLIGRDTVNTMPPETIDAFRDHGHAASTLDADIPEARAVLMKLDAHGISLDKITGELVVDGVAKFSEAADQLLAALEDKRDKILGSAIVHVAAELGPTQNAFDDELEEWRKSGRVRAIWARDKSVWSGSDEDRWLGWLDIAAREAADLQPLNEVAAGIQREKFHDAVLLGMGGSSLGADVLRAALGRRPDWPRLHVLDSTDPAQILAVQRAITLDRTLFIVSSKSGTTLEPNILMDHFFHGVAEKLGGEGGAGKHFIAITDPGTPLEDVAKRRGFRHVFHGDPAIGGRYSVLSKFGLVPAAVSGLDVARLLREAQRMATSCHRLVPPAANPGIRLGVALGVLARDFHRDKITILASPALASVGSWLEQLIAESTGKHGKGLIPVDGEPLGAAKLYGADRVFVQLHLAGAEDRDARLTDLTANGHPVIRIAVEDQYQIGQLFFLWEIAIAAAGAVIGIDPFDQPDVEASKKKSQALTAEFERQGSLQQPSPVCTQDGIALYADLANAAAKGRTISECLRAHLDGLREGDYFALLAYMERADAHEAALQTMRLKIRDAKKVATCLGFGPRYLHSTGQAYKGGPNTGVFLTVTSDHGDDIALQNRKASFGAVEFAQALGDFEVLNERGRRAVRVHLRDLESGLAALGGALNQALN